MDTTKNNLTNTRQQPLLLESELILFTQAVKDAAYFGVPFALSRLVFAIQNFLNATIIAQLSSNAIAAAPLAFMIQYCGIGWSRGALAVFNHITGTLNGEEKFDKIGPAINQALAMATFLSIPLSVLFFTAPDWLPLLGIHESIAQQAGQFLRAQSFGMIPLFWSYVDQNFLLSMKRRLPPVMLNTLSVGLSMAIGYPLVLKNNNLAGLGYGMSIAGFITFIVGRIYLYFKRVDGVLDCKKYQLFPFSTGFNSGTSFKEIASLSFPAALQALSEWLPTTLISLIIARSPDADRILEAEAPAMQVLMTLNQIILGLGTAAAVSVATALGTAKKRNDANRIESAKEWRQNARTIGYAELAVACIVMLPFTLFCASYPTPLVQLFSNKNQDVELAVSILRVTGATLLLDAVRITAGSNLLGRKNSADNFFISLTNLLITAGVGIALGYFSRKILGPLSFFITRMIAISITSCFLLYRWDSRSNPEIAPAIPTTTCWDFFGNPCRKANNGRRKPSMDGSEVSSELTEILLPADRQFVDTVKSMVQLDP